MTKQSSMVYSRRISEHVFCADSTTNLILHGKLCSMITNAKSGLLQSQNNYLEFIFNSHETSSVTLRHSDIYFLLAGIGICALLTHEVIA